jgi:chromosome segregation ATPase
LFVVRIENTAEFRKALTNAQHSITDKQIKKQVDLKKDEYKQELLEEFKHQIQTLSEKVKVAEQEIEIEKSKVQMVNKKMDELIKQKESLLEENKKMASDLEKVEEQRRGKVHLIMKAEEEKKQSVEYRLERCKEIYQDKMGSTASFDKDVRPSISSYFVSKDCFTNNMTLKTANLSSFFSILHDFL